MGKRTKVINEILADLQKLETTCPPEQRYALEENVRFFKASRSPLAYFWWLLTRAPFIDGERLKELADFGIPRWEKELLVELAKAEKKKLPGIIKPLVNVIVDFVEKNRARDSIILMDLGCGGMEVEKQIIRHLVNKEYPRQLIFIGVDKSDTSYGVARENLKDVESLIQMNDIEELNEKTLNDFKNLSGKRMLLIWCKNDILELDKCFRDKTIDLIFYSKFKHHLDSEGKSELDRVTTQIGKVVMEYDDYRSWPLLVPQSIFAWRSPVLLNGAVFSRLRDPALQELASQPLPGWNTQFFKIGSYLKVYRS